jgi:hypothetical protein
VSILQREFVQRGFDHTRRNKCQQAFSWQRANSIKRGKPNTQQVNRVKLSLFLIN